MAEVKHNQGEAGGYLVGRRHSEGGIKAVNKSTGQPLEMEGGEVVITRNAVSDNTKRSFNGKMMTNREILSTINQSGGGVAFAEGGEVPESIDYVDMVFEYDGQELDSRKILEKMAEGGQVDSILSSIESQYVTNGDCAPCGGDLTGSIQYAEGGRIIELPSIGSGFDKRLNRVVGQKQDGTWNLDTGLDPRDFDEGTLETISEEDVIKIFLTMGDLTPISIQNKIPPKAHLIGLKSNLFLIYREQSSGKKVELGMGGFLDVPSYLESRVGDNIPIDGEFDLKLVIKIKTANLAVEYDFEVQQTFTLATIQNYTYSELVSNFLILLTSQNGWKDEYNTLFKEHFKIYVAGIDAELYYSQGADRQTNGYAINFGSQAAFENQDVFNPVRILTSFESFNSKEFEKVTKKLNPLQATTIGIRARLFLRTFGHRGNIIRYGVQSIMAVNFVGQPKSKNTFEWWKTAFFGPDSITHYARLEGDKPQYDMKLDALDFSAFENDFVVTKVKRQTTQTQLKIQTELEKVENATLVKAEFDYLGTTEISQPFIFDAEAPNWTKDVRCQISSLSRNQPTRQRFAVRQDKIDFFSSGKNGIFFFGRTDSLIAEFDKEKAERERQEALERERLRKEAEAAERKAAKAAEEALKNRPFKVRDQKDDIKFFPIHRDSTVDEEISIAREAIQKEVTSLRTLLKFTTGAKMADERAAIIREISLLERKELKLVQAMINKFAYPTLLSPQSLLDYYYSQATQNPTVPLGEASGLSTPSGKPSKLPLQAYYAVRTTFFKRWFGDWELAYVTKDYNNCSILVDEETGEPRLMFHGVRKKVPGVQMGAMGSGVKRPYGEFNPPNFPATYFTDDYDYVKFYAGEADNQPKPTPDYEGFIYSVFINMRNPVVIADLGLKTSYKELLTNIYLNYGVKAEPSKDLLNKIASDTNADLKTWNYVRYDLNLIESLKRAGYDGIIQIGDVPSFGDNQQMIGMVEGGEYLVFNAEQVKSATVKNSFYVPFIKDIRFKEGGHVRI
jgi:hypothetical protein